MKADTQSYKQGLDDSQRLDKTQILNPTKHTIISYLSGYANGIEQKVGLEERKQFVQGIRTGKDNMPRLGINNIYMLIGYDLYNQYRSILQKSQKPNKQSELDDINVERFEQDLPLLDSQGYKNLLKDIGSVYEDDYGFDPQLK